MFKLYYFTGVSNKPDLLYTNADLGPCFDFMRMNHLVPPQCIIVTPNNRRVTFNANNTITFSEFVAA